jgi:rubredoxin
MLRLICPKCKKDSYSAGVESFSGCPYCGFIFSGKYGDDRRREERIKQETPFAFSCQEQNFEANTIDFSERGVGIKILGEPSIATGDIINLSIGDFQIRAKVMWVKKMSDKSLAGLKRLN